MKPALLALAVLAACAPAGEVQRLQSATPPAAPVEAWDPGPARPLTATRGNAEMAADFLELGFQMESGRAIEAFSRFEGPVRVLTNGVPPPGALVDLERLLARLRSEAGIDIARVPATEATANRITVEFLPRRQMQAVVPAAACFVVPNVESWAEFVANRRSPAIDWTRTVVRTRAVVFIPSDTTPQEVRDCLHEEIGQALGPLNDLFRLSDSVFNDDNFQTTLTGFDMLLLRVWNSPDLAPGMTRDEVAARLTTVFNRLNPAGRGRGDTLGTPTPRAWQLAIEQALGAEGGIDRRREAAGRALTIARGQGWSDGRLALSLMLSARLAPREQGQVALDALLAAGEIWRRSPGGAVHAAHVDMHLAVQALASGQAEMAAQLAGQAMEAATRSENAAFIASLGFIRAEALAALGRADEAAALRLDSMAAARYGFGSEAAARARMDEIARIGSAAPRLARL